MIITLKGANFETNRIGTIDSYSITRVIDAGSSYSGPTSVKKNESYSGSITIKSNYELSGSVTVTMGGNPVTPTINGKTISISIASVTGNIVIKALTIPTVVVPDTPTVTTYTVTYQINGHGSQPASVTGVTKLPSTLPVLSATGWTFGGWYTNSACTTSAVAGATISADTTLYAKWTEVVVEEPEVDSNTCTHSFGSDNKCSICGMPNYTKVSIVINEGIQSVTVTKTAGWNATGQTITDGMNVNIGDQLTVVIVPESGYTVVGETTRTVGAYSGGCVISPTATIIEDVTYETVTPADTTTGAEYYLTTAAANSGPYSNWKYVIYDVTPGRKYHIQAYSGQAARMWIMFKGADITGDNVLSYSTDSTSVGLKEEYVVAPAGAVKMVVNTRTDKSNYPIVEVHPTYQE